MNESPAKTGFNVVVWRNIFLIFLILWFLLPGAYHGATSADTILTGLDFRVFYQAANRLNLGQALYVYDPTGGPYVYTPALALLLRPIATHPFETALKLWFLINAVCILLGITLYASAARTSLRDAAAMGILLILTFRFWPTSMNFALGQVNFVLLFLVCALFFVESRGWWTAFGLLIAAAALVKTWMLGLVIYLLLRRRWREAALSVVAFGVLLGVLFTVVGWKEWPLFVRLTSGFANQTIGQYAATQSIPGFAHLHFAHNTHVSPLVDSPLLFKGFIGLGLVLIVVGLSRLWRHTPMPGSNESRLELGWVILSLLLLLPMCQTEYFVLALPLLWELLAPSGGERRVPVAAVVGAFLVYLLFTRGWTTNDPIPLDYRQGLRSLLVSMYFYGAAALWFVSWYALRCLSFREKSAGRAPEIAPVALREGVSPNI